MDLVRLECGLVLNALQQDLNSTKGYGHYGCVESLVLVPNPLTQEIASMATELDIEPESVEIQKDVQSPEEKNYLNIVGMGVASKQTKGGFGWYFEEGSPPFNSRGI